MQASAEPERRVPAEVQQAETPYPRLRVHHRFESNILPDARDVIVYLPPGYDEPTVDAQLPRHYPILYMQDGQNLFDPETSFIRGRTWQIREQADEGIEAGLVEPLIIVGVYNAGERRLAEYTPSQDWKMGGGEAEEYGKLLVQELMPFIDRMYRTKKGPRNSGLGGSSLGGLVSLYLGLQLPQVFGKLAVLSPSVWWDHKRILGYVNEFGYVNDFGQSAHQPDVEARSPLRPKIWLDVGDHEGRRTLSDADLLETRLRANGWKAEETLHYERVHGGTHDEAAWAQRVLPMLRFLFPA